MHSNKGKTYIIPEKHDIANEEFCDNVRKRLKLDKKQLSNRDIRAIIKLNGKLIGDWIINNADGFKIKDNGILIVSKWLPKCLRGEKLEKIDEIMNNPYNTDYVKEMFTKRYNKSLEFYKKWNKEGKEYHTNLHSFFYIYRVMWFNSRNCKFDKAELYEIKASKELKKKLNQKIIEGKDYFSWLFSDFRQRKTKDKLERKEALRIKKELKEKYKDE